LTTPGTANVIDGSLLARLAQDIIVGIGSVSHGQTVTQTAQVLDLGDGRKAAIRVTITTDADRFL
jgi:hypothetical protein